MPIDLNTDKTALFRHFTEDVYFTGVRDPVKAFVDERAVDIVIGGQEVYGIRTTLLCHHEDVALVKRGTNVRLTSKSGVYTVVSNEPEEDGFSHRIVLEAP